MLFDPSNKEGLAAQIAIPYQHISLGITGPVKNSCLYVNPYRSEIPRELAAECEKIAQKSVTLENDAIIWAKGVLLLQQQLLDSPISFPCLGITLGTGVGVILIRSPEDMVAIEISFLDRSNFSNTFEKSPEQSNESLENHSPHNALGAKFFNWVEKECPNWTTSKIRADFNNRLIAFCSDMESFCNHTLKTKINSVVLGGGNSRLVDTETLTQQLKKEVLTFSPEYISSYGLSFDIVQLLGCLNYDLPSTPYYPPLEHLVNSR